MQITGANAPSDQANESGSKISLCHEDDAALRSSF
jgi:hypothetical protein